MSRPSESQATIRRGAAAPSGRDFARGRADPARPATSAPAILLVEDDPAVRSSIAFALEVEGFEVRAFSTAEAVLAEPGDPVSACIVLDYRLPGMDGVALLRILRARGCSAPAIVITSNPGRGLRRRVVEAGGRLLEKPLLSDALAAAIRGITGADGEGA